MQQGRSCPTFITIVSHCMLHLTFGYDLIRTRLHAFYAFSCHVCQEHRRVTTSTLVSSLLILIKHDKMNDNRIANSTITNLLAIKALDNNVANREVKMITPDRNDSKGHLNCHHGDDHGDVDEDVVLYDPDGSSDSLESTISTDKPTKVKQMPESSSSSSSSSSATMTAERTVHSEKTIAEFSVERGEEGRQEVEEEGDDIERQKRPQQHQQQELRRQPSSTAPPSPSSMSFTSPSADIENRQVQELPPAPSTVPLYERDEHRQRQQLHQLLPPRTTPSYIQSLPEVEALPEKGTDRKTNSIVVAEVTDVIPIPQLEESENLSSLASVPLSPTQSSSSTTNMKYGDGNYTTDEDDIEAQNSAADLSADYGVTSSSAVSTDQHTTTRPALMSVSVFKVTREDKLGIALETVNGKLKVLRINTDDSNDDNDSDHVTSLLSKSQIQVGDNVLSINNQYCARWSPTLAIQYLKSLVGLVSIMISDDRGDQSLSRAIIIKQTTSDRVGIAFAKEHGRLRITSIYKNGLLGGSDCNGNSESGEGGDNGDHENAQNSSLSALNVGDYMVSINGIDCMELSPRTAKELIVNSPNNVVTLVAMTTESTIIWGLEESRRRTFSEDYLTDDPSYHGELVVAEATQISCDIHGIDGCVNDNGSSSDPMNMIGHEGISPAYISIMIVKPTTGTPLGVKLNYRTSDGSGSSGEDDSDGDTSKVLSISAIAPGSILSATPLRPGFIMLSINNKPCRTGNKTKAAQYLRESYGELNLVVQNPDGDPNYVQAMAMKLDPRAKVGIGFQGYTFGTDYVKISSINPMSIFAHSVLNVGDKVLSINAQSCRNYRPSDAVNLVKQAKETLNIVVETSHSSGIVVSDSGNLRATSHRSSSGNNDGCNDHYDNGSHLRLLDEDTFGHHHPHLFENTLPSQAEVEGEQPQQRRHIPRSQWTPEMEQQERASKEALNAFIVVFIVILAIIILMTIPEF